MRGNNFKFFIRDFFTFKLLVSAQEVLQVEPPKPVQNVNGDVIEDPLMMNRIKLAQKFSGQKKKADKQ